MNTSRTPEAARQEEAVAVQEWQKAGWVLVPERGSEVKAGHPITCLNPSETFIVHERQFDGDKVFVRGENTAWFGLAMVSPAQPFPAPSLQAGESVQAGERDRLVGQNFGAGFEAAFETVTSLPGSFQGYTPAEDPSEIVLDLAEALSVAQGALVCLADWIEHAIDAELPTETEEQDAAIQEARRVRAAPSEAKP